jgi:uncharacterized membrane protein
MSDRASGHPGRSRLVARASLLLGLAGVIAGPLAPLALAAGGLTVTTPFPAVVADAGSTASFKLAISVPSTTRVSLKADGVPSGWTTRFRGGGLTIDGAYVDPKTPPDVTLDVVIPDGTAAGTSTVTVVATDSAGQTDRLPLTIRVAEATAGEVTLTSDYPELRGPSTSTFQFNLTLKNGGTTETTFAIDATGPDGWTVTAKPSGQAQATSTVVPAGGSASIALSAQAPADVAAGPYPVVATATGGGKAATAQMQVTITGTYTLAVSTPDQVLSTTANAGTQKDVQVTITNTGTAPVTAVTPSATAPTGWKVAFDPATLPSIDAGKTETITAQITPTADAIAGDYEVTVTGKGAEASDNVTLRVRVETPQFWWIAGIVLIVAVFAGLYWVFRTYGRR